MAHAVLMPKQGQSVESCIITEWYKKKGDKVSKGDLLFGYETDKASFEEEAKEEGILLDIFYEEGDEVPVLTNVAVIGNEGESTAEFQPDAEAAEKEEAAPEETKSEEPASQKETAGEISSSKKVKISPRAKRMADDKGVDYKSIAGSGSVGRIIVRDIEKAIDEGAAVQKETAKAPEAATAAKQAPEKPKKEAVILSKGEDYADEELTNMRKMIANAMFNSLQNSAQLTHHLSADARKILGLRKKVKAMQKEGYDRNITLNDMICYAVIKALRKNPDANAHFLGDSIRKFTKIHLGIAVDTERGLMVPALQNADDLSLEGLSSQLKILADSCRKGSVDPDLLASTAASFTISNLGNYGVEMFTPIINVPQAAILGVNTIINRPVEIEPGIIGFAPFIGLSLTYDHRAIDGGPATLFLAEIKNEIENFNTELI